MKPILRPPIPGLWSRGAPSFNAVTKARVPHPCRSPSGSPTSAFARCGDRAAWMKCITSPSQLLPLPLPLSLPLSLSLSLSLSLFLSLSLPLSLSLSLSLSLFLSLSLPLSFCLSSRRDLLLSLLLFVFRIGPTTNVISTEALDSITVQRAAERSLYFVLALVFAFVVAFSVASKVGPAGSPNALALGLPGH